MTWVTLKESWTDQAGLTFVYAWEFDCLPIQDGGFIAFASAAVGVLHRPAQTFPEETPHVVVMKAQAEMAINASASRAVVHN